MLQQPNKDMPFTPNNGFYSVLTDRRSNPYIRTRQRRTFDRRKSYRVGTTTLVFLYVGGEIRPGTLKDISDSGACIEVERNGSEVYPILRMAIPSLQDKMINCKVNWSKNGAVQHLKGRESYGVTFFDLTNNEKNELRKTILLDESVLLGSAQDVLRKTEDFYLQQEIKSFFLIDVKRTMESLIDIETMIAEGVDDAIVMKKCKKVLDRLAETGDRLESLLNNESLIKEIKQRLRALLGHFVFQSNNFRRGFEKPRGYPGDYKMLEIVYDDLEISEGLGRYIDRYGLEVPYSIGIRMRKDTMKEILYKFINDSTKDKLNILNLASGGCRDIREMFARPITYRGKVNLMCIDQDEEAIEFSRQKLSEIDVGNIDVNLIQGNILKLESLDIGEENSIDMVYSIGIADYLQDRMLKKIFNDCYKMLRPGGKFVLAYKDKEIHKPLALNWYADWCFIPRDEKEFITLIYEAMGKENISIDIKRIDTKVIFFAEITKKI